MNAQLPLSPDDPLLTAYALGELEGTDFAQVDAAVRADPALQAAVAELRAFGLQLASALAAEPAPAIPEHAAPPAQVDAFARPPKKRRLSLIPLPLFIYGLAAAVACLAALLWLTKVDAFAPRRQEAKLALTMRGAKVAEGTGRTAQIATNAVVDGLLPQAPATIGTMQQPFTPSNSPPGANASALAAANGSLSKPVFRRLDGTLAKSYARQLAASGQFAADKDSASTGYTAGAVDAYATATPAVGGILDGYAVVSRLNIYINPRSVRYEDVPTIPATPPGTPEGIDWRDDADSHTPPYDALSTFFLLVDTRSYDALCTIALFNASSHLVPPPASDDALFASHLEVPSANLKPPPPAQN